MLSPNRAATWSVRPRDKRTDSERRELLARFFNARAALAAALLLSGFAAVAPARAQVGMVEPSALATILAHPGVPVAGGRATDVTIVEYFDYNCPYCRRAAGTLAELRATDPGVSVLYKEWPIFGGVSLIAARSALAAGWQGRYLAAHDALIAGSVKLASEADVLARLQAAGIDLSQLRRDLIAHGRDIDQTLVRNNAEARGLGFEGTPGLVIGAYVMPGALDVADMRTLVRAARRP